MQTVSRILLLPAGFWLTPLLSAIGAVFGIAGSLLLARQPADICAVFALYLISNLAWIGVSVRTRQSWLLLMNAAYLSINIYGALFTR